MKRKLLICVSIVIIIVFCFVIPIIGVENNDIKGDYYIYNHFDEIESLNLNYIKTYDISYDKYLKGIIPINSHLGKVEYEGKKYSFFVYEFSSNVDAKQYIKNVTGRDSNSNSSFSWSGNYYLSNRI